MPAAPLQLVGQLLEPVDHSTTMPYYSTYWTDRKRTPFLTKRTDSYELVSLGVKEHFMREMPDYVQGQMS